MVRVTTTVMKQGATTSERGNLPAVIDGWVTNVVRDDKAEVDDGEGRKTCLEPGADI